MKTFKHNTIFLIISNSLQVSLSLILSIGLARYFEQKDVFGKYQQLFVVVNFLLLFTTGIPLAMSYFYGKYLDFSSRIKIYKRFAMTLLFLAVILGTSIYFLSGVLSETFKNNFFEDFIKLLVAILIFKIINSFFLHFCLTRGTLKYYFYIICFEFIATISILFCVYKFNWSISSILTGLIIIASIKFFLLLISAKLYFKIKGTFILKKAELNYILPMTATTITSALTIYTDKFMISSFLNPESFAEYQIGAFSIPFIGVITGSIVTALIPTLSRLKSENKPKEIIEQVRLATKKTTLFLLPILIYSIILGDKLITLLYSDSYYNSGIIFQMYTCIYLLTVIAFSAVMNAVGLEKWVFRNSVLCLVLNVSFNLILIPLFGVFGAIFATLLTTYLGCFLPIYFIKKRLNAKFLDYFPIQFYLKILIISLILGLLILFLNDFFNFNKWVILLLSFPFYLIVILLGGGKTSIKNGILLNKHLKL